MDSPAWSKVEALFLEVAELWPADRSRALDRSCAGDPHLRVEVESLLAHDCGNDDLITTPLAEESALVLNGPALEGMRVGAYRLIREIGRGGMGAVFLAARADDEFQKQVAVKVVKHGMDTADVLRRFRHERQILAALEHPFIARLIDGGSTGDGRPFLVMELVDGQPIDRYCRDRNLTLAARCRLFLKVCEAVSYAHRKLIVHRDLKPGNIFLTADGSPRLLDFGLAKILDAETDGGLTALQPARPLTPGYASPEQIRGEALSTGTDVYSLGVVLRELTAGIAPGGELDTIVKMATRDEADRRYTSVEDFAGDIRRFLESRPVLARADSFQYRAGKFVRRRRLPLLAGAAIFASLTAGMVAAMIQARKAEARLAEMVNLTDHSIAAVTSLLERLPGSVAARKELIGATLDSLERLSKDAGQDPRPRVALAKAYLQLGELQGGPEGANLGDLAGALKSYRRGTALLDETGRNVPAGADRVGVWLSLQQKTAMLLALREDQVGAEDVVRRAIAVADRLPASLRVQREIALSYAGLHHALARAAVRLDPRQALQYATAYLDALTAIGQRDPAAKDLQYDLSMAHTEVGYDYLLLGDPEGAAGHYEKSLRLREQLTREHPTDAVYRRSLMLAYEHYGSLQGGVLMPSLGRTEIAREYLNRAKALEEESVADPQNSLAAGDYAAFLLKLGSLAPGTEGPAESLAVLRHAAERLEPLRTASPAYAVRTATTYVYVGHRLSALGRYAEASRQYQRAADLTEAILQAHPDDWDGQLQRWDATCARARSLALEGNGVAAREQADQVMRRAKELESRRAGTAFRGSWTAQAYLTEARVHHALGERAAAREAAQQAVRLAAPLATGRVWDPNGKILRDAQALITDGARSSAR